MDAQTFFDKRLIPDQSIAQILAYCAGEFKPHAYVIPYGARDIAIKPYGVLIDFSYFATTMNMPKEIVLEKLQRLVVLERADVEFQENYALIYFDDKFVPRKWSVEAFDPTKNLKKISWEGWKQNDTAMFLIEQSMKYQEMAKTVFKDFALIVRDRTIDEINLNDYERYKKLLLDRKASNTTVNNYMRCLRASLKRAVRSRYILEDPFGGVKPMKQERRAPLVIGKVAFAELLEQIDAKWMKYLVRMAISTGMRRGEIINLRWKNVDELNSVIHIVESEDFKPKFNKSRDIPMNKGIRLLLEEIKIYQRDNEIESEYVFTDERGKRLLGNRVTKLFKEECRMYFGDDTKFHFHILRKTFATKLREGGVARNTIKALLGHASERTTSKYIGCSPEENEEAMENPILEEYIQ
jgi:integrase